MLEMFDCRCCVMESSCALQARIFILDASNLLLKTVWKSM